MLVEILDGLQYLVMWITPMYMIYLFLLMMKDSRKDINKVLKFLVVFGILITTIFCFMIVLVLNIYQVAIIWKDYEIETGELVSPLVKELSFFSVMFVWNLITIVLMHFAWKNIYYKQLIPGEGTVKKRLKKVWRDFKNELKQDRNKK